MAITISQQPQAFAPAYNDQYVTALSTEIAQPNFKYKVEVDVTYVLNGTPTTSTFIYYHAPRPDGTLVFNAMETVKNFINHFMNPNDFNIVECVNSKVDVSIDIIETWTGSIGTTSTITYKAWNASLTEKQAHYSNYNYGDFISTNSEIKLHNVEKSAILPNNIATMNQDVFLQFVKPADLFRINYLVIDTNGVDILDSYTYTGSMTTNKIYQINASPQLAINQSFTIAEDYFIQVVFLKSNLSTVIGSYTFKIGSLCTKHDVNRIYYLNRNGGISSFPFEMLSTQTIDAKTSEVSLGNKELISGVYTSLPYKHETFTVSTEETYMVNLQTNWITAQQSIYLEELFSSPLKWLVNEEVDYGDLFAYVPITSMSKQYLINKHENMKLFNYGIEVKLSIKETRQRAL
jgi:hypothetical protein